MNELFRPKPAPLPQTTEELLANRKMQREATLNDHVDAIHVRLWSDRKYRQLLEAVYDEDATEGSLSYDNYQAAEMIRDFARKDKADPYLTDKRLATIVKALGIVLRRYGFSRKERAMTVGGEIVPTNGD